MKFARASAAAAALVTVGLVPAITSEAKQPSYVIDWDQVEREIEDVERATGQDVLSGEIAGAAWIAQVPEDWNGDLVIYAHGYRGEGTDLTVDAAPGFEWLTENGYAWAASSYRRNSYDPGIGVVDTKNLTRHVQNMLRGDGLDKTYLTGFSMGGHVTAAAIERYPNLYDGAMPACGVMGDVELFDYFLDYNVGGAALAGVAPDFAWPDQDWLSTTAPLIKAGLSNVPDGVAGPNPFTSLSWAGGFPRILNPAVPSPLNVAGSSFKDFVEIGSGGERATFDAAWEYWHGIDAPLGEFFLELGQGDGTIAGRSGLVSQNVDMTYADEYGPEFASIDERVVRVEAANRIRSARGIKPAVLIDGDPSIPVLSIHTTGDLFVPIEMQQIYAREVAANERSDLLVQRAIRDIGHCSFTADEIIQSYTDLFDWVENGVKPAGEDLVADIGSPTIGCDFTTGAGGSGFRFALEPCPGG